MTEKSFRKKVCAATAMFFNGKKARASALFEKLCKLEKTPGFTAYLEFHRAMCEEKSENFCAAAELAESCAVYYGNAEQRNDAYASYKLLGDILSADKRYDAACDAYLKAEQFTDAADTVCEIKVLCAEARMKSDTVYETHLFTQPCDEFNKLLKAGAGVNTDLYTRSCAIAAQACHAVGKEPECLEYCTIGVAFSDMRNYSSPQVFECAALNCRSAARLWNNELIGKVASTSYSYVAKHFRPDDRCYYVSLIYALTQANLGERSNAQTAMEKVKFESASLQNRLYFKYCEGLIAETPLILSREILSIDCVDDFCSFAEACIDDGFFDLAADIYKFGLSCYGESQPLILRPYASLLYKLGRFSESAECYRILTAECSEPVLYRAYSLTSMRAGDIDTAKRQLQLYTDTSENQEDALDIAAHLSMDEGYPPEFCASLFARLTALLEAHGESTDELVNAYNCLGISLYRSTAPVEAEISAFKKAAFHAEVCVETNRTNIHGVILSNLAECYLRKGDTELCYSIYRKADEIFSALDDVDIINHTTCLKFIADLQLLQNEKNEAVETLKRATGLLEPAAAENPAIAHQLSLCRNALGTVYFQLGKPELEIPELTKAIDLISKFPVDNASLALLYSNRGEAYEVMGKYSLMEKDYSAALGLADKSDAEQHPRERLSQAAKWLSIGRFREDSNEHENAISAYKSALKLLSPLCKSNNSDADELTAFAYYQLGNTYCNDDVKDFSSSLASYSRSLDILEKLPPSPSRSFHLATTYDARASFYEVFGEHTLALADHRRAVELRNSLTEFESK